MNRHFFRAISSLTLLACITGTAQAQPFAPATGIRVLVYGIHYGGNLVYNYNVINNSGAPFNNFTIGGYYDVAQDYEYPQLTRLPLGWTYGIVGETGTAIILAPGSTSQPPYWMPHVFGQQDTVNYYLEWSTPWGDGSNVIHSGQTISGFSVTIPLVDNELFLPAVTGQPAFTGPDEKYLKGNFKVGFGSEKNFQEVMGPLELEDTTPPSLSVTLSPNTLRPNEKLIPITATITVKDNYDPLPDIKLEAITANEVLDQDDIKGAQAGADIRQFQLKAEREGKNKTGRIYTVTYSATDASGNKSIASATVTVPHDQDEHAKDGERNKDRRE